MNLKLGQSNNPVTCCLCTKPAAWIHYDDYGIPRNTYCEEHKP